MGTKKTTKKSLIRDLGSKAMDRKSQKKVRGGSYTCPSQKCKRLVVVVEARGTHKVVVVR